jgi:hypothetical protein
MPVQQTQFFLSSAVADSRNEGNTLYSVALDPNLRVPENAKSARCFVHSATIPYTFPNIDSTNNALIVDAGVSTTTISLDTGVYSLTDMQDAINQKVNAYLHTAGEAALVDGSGKANFCTLAPDNQRNRVKITFAHLGTGCSFEKAGSTIAPVLGFTQLTGYAEPTLTVSTGEPLVVTIEWYMSGSNTPTSTTVTIGDGTYTASQFKDALNAGVKSATYYVSSIISSLTITPSEYVPGEYTAAFTYTATSGTYAVFAGGQDATIQAAFGFIGTGRRATRWSGQGPTHTASNAAQVDKVTEVGIAAPGLTHGAYSTDGTASLSTLARFQVDGAPGSNLIFAPDQTLKSNVDHLIGTSVQTVSLALVDQHGVQLTTLLGEHWSVILVLEVET